ncbi:hypothetical protein TNCV_4003801 [Trichonephila clavipes]|nr:hypothetical protein TNCV_4003801 [Trichonephila clavipes]
MHRTIQAKRTASKTSHLTINYSNRQTIQQAISQWCLFAKTVRRGGWDMETAPLCLSRALVIHSTVALSSTIFCVPSFPENYSRFSQSPSAVPDFFSSTNFYLC